LTKAELANEAAKTAGLTKAKALTVADAFFETRRRIARQNRNPQKPTAVIGIPEKTVPVFRAGKALKLFSRNERVYLLSSRRALINSIATCTKQFALF
jgi:nucleoid DNA-binding protein